LILVFNFHPHQSFTDYKVGCRYKKQYKVVLSSDEPVFGGYNNVSKDYNTTFDASDDGHDGRPHSFFVYTPSRSVLVFAPAEYVDHRADSKPTGIPGLGVMGRGPYFAV